MLSDAKTNHVDPTRTLRRPMSNEELQDCMTRIFFAVRDLKQISKNAHLSSAKDAGECAAHLEIWLEQTSKLFSSDI